MNNTRMRSGASAVGVVLIILIIVLGLGLLFRAMKSAQTNQPADTVVNTGSSQGSQNTEPQQSQSLLVVYTDSGFSPANLEVPMSNTMVTFRNDSSRMMRVASDPHPTHSGLPGFDAGRGMNSGETFSFVFPPQARSYGYHNHLYANDRGTITIR